MKMATYQSRLAGSAEVRAESRTARRRHVAMGVIGYLVPAVLLALGVKTLFESMGVDLTPPTVIAVVAVGLAIAVWRGATVSAAVRPDGLRVRNRWRQLVVPWNEVESAEIGSSITYGLFDLVDDLYDIANNTASVGSTPEEDMQFSDVLLIARRGRRRRLPVYATLGMTRHPAEMRAFVDAIAAHGIDVTRERSVAPQE